MMMLALAIMLLAVRVSGNRTAVLAGATEWSVRTTTARCPDYENTSAVGGTASVK